MGGVCSGLILSSGRRIKQLLEQVHKFTDELHERSEELAIERQRAEALLYEALPKAIAEDLKNHRTVEPQKYEEVTVFFCGIYGFTALASNSSPMQVQ